VVDNSPWLQEITLRSPEIIAALAGQFGAGTVRSLRVTLGQLETAPRTEPPRAPARPGVTEDDRRAIEALVEPIPDLDLRASIRRLLLKASRLR